MPQKIITNCAKGIVRIESVLAGLSLCSSYLVIECNLETANSFMSKCICLTGLFADFLSESASWIMTLFVD